jgi:MarR family 2-MHQ and catechol resistance regulon transcriptional repressor
MTDTTPTLSTHLWLILHKAYQAVLAHALKSIDETGLGLMDFAVLEVLLHKGPQPVNTIAEKVLLTSGSMTAAVDRLSDKGLVERHASPTDRRVRMVHLTEAGQALITESFAYHQAGLAVATDGLSPEEKRELIRLLKKLGKHARSVF